MTFENWMETNHVNDLINVLLRLAYNAGVESTKKNDTYPDHLDLERRKAKTS